MKDKILDFIKENRLLEGGENVLVAFSGGADSSALLDFFVEAAGELGVTVRAAHFNHLIRGEEALRDLRFCRDVCARRGVPFSSGEGDVIDYASQSGLSLEMAARRLRYEFLEETAAKYGSVIATAHNADDNLETMILNLARGTGARGLCGIPPRRGNIIRPALCVTKAEILAYCAEKDIKYVTDSTNGVDDCGRNLIRHRVVPVLRELNGSVENSALRTALMLRETEEYAEKEAAELLGKSAASAGIPDAWDCAVLRAAPKPLRTRAAIQIFEKYGIFGSFGEIGELDALICAGSGHRTLKNIPFDACKGLLTVTDECQDTPPVVLKPGANWVNGRRIELKMIPKLGKISKKLFKTSLNYDMIKGNLVARSRRAGDVFSRPDGNGSKTLKKLFNELGVPVGRRSRVLVLADDGGVVFVEGIGSDRRAAPAAGCSALEITFDEQEVRR